MKIEVSDIIDKIGQSKIIAEYLAAASTSLYLVMNLIYNMKHQIQCEDYYQVPGKYFHSTINNRLLYLALVIAMIVACFTPVAIKKYYEKNGHTKFGDKVYVIFLTVVIGMEMGFFNVYNLIEIMRQTYKAGDIFININSFLNRHANITIAVVVILGSMSLLGITLLDEIKNIKFMIIKQIIIVMFGIALLLSILFMVYGTIFKLSINIEDKTKYEFVMQGKKEYVILTEYDEKILVVPYKKLDNGQYIFYTNKYYFIEKYQGVYRYIDCTNGIKIESEKTYDAL